MTKIKCTNYDCVYCEKYSCLCQRNFVAIGDEYTYGCEDYISYLDTDEYKERFYRAVKTKDGKVAKATDFGKKIEFNGRVFFTTDKVDTNKVNEDDAYAVTEERTGYLMGDFAYLKNDFEKFLEAEKKIPDVKNYPLAVRAEGGYVIAKKGGD